MKLANLLFVGERSPELAGLEPGERRLRYLLAARRSYRRAKTWIGFVLFLVLLINQEEFANTIGAALAGSPLNESSTVAALRTILVVTAWICLWRFQVSAIRDELKKQTNTPDGDSGKV